MDLTKLNKYFPDFDNTLLVTRIAQELKDYDIIDATDYMDELPRLISDEYNGKFVEIFVNYNDNPINDTSGIHEDIEVYYNVGNSLTEFDSKEYSMTRLNELKEDMKEYLS